MILRTCTFCFAERAAEIRFDKRGRPYLVCRLCHTRCFFRSLDAVRGLAICPTLIAAAIERRKTEPKFRDWFDGEIAKTISFVTANAVAPPTRVEHMGLSPEQSPIPFDLGVQGVLSNTP
jgi:hypothetical protein